MFFSTRRRRAAWFSALLSVAAIAALALIREEQLAVADQAVVHTLAVQRAIGDTLSALKDAETGQRGFLLSGDADFLTPYVNAIDAIPQQLAELQREVAADAAQSERVREVQLLAADKLAELAATIALFRGHHPEEALARVREGQGRRLMVAIREQTDRMLAQENAALARQEAAASKQRAHLRYVLYTSAFGFVGIAVVGLWSVSRGIAEARNASARLKSSEQAFRSLADNASDLVRVIDGQGQLVYVSPSCQAILGYSQIEMLGLPARALLPENERDEARRLTEAARAGGGTDEPFVHRLVCKGGSQRWFETKYRVTETSAAVDRHIQLTTRDITERCVAEDALRKQTRRLESILSSMGDGVVVVDEGWAMLYVNPVAAGYMRQAPGELVTSDWVERHQARELDGTTAFVPQRGPLSQALAGHSVDGLGLVLRDKQGVDRAFSVTARPIQDGAATAGCVAVYRDITEQRLAKRELEESEQRQRVLSEASFEGIAISRDGIFLDVNTTFASWFGSTRESLVGKPGLPLFAPEDQARLSAMSGQAGAMYEAQMLRPDGSRFSVEVRGRDATFRGSPARIAVLRDITEKKRQEAELIEQAEQLRALSLKDELTGLHNRRGFIEHARQLLLGAARSERNACVFFIDLNGMKGINDSLGHEVGDRALCAAALVLSSVFRDSDIVSRLGGDEFAIFASECGAADVPRVNERLRAKTLEFNATTNEPFRLSMSVGSATFEPGSKSDLEALMETADQHMYEEKRAARGIRTVLAARPRPDAEQAR